MKKDMKSYLSLIPISAKTRRKQNRLTLICIILAVFLVTSVFSFAEIMIKGDERAMIKKHGSYHIIINGISGEDADKIAGRDDVAVTAWYRALGENDYENYKINDTRVILYGAEQAYVYDIRNYEYEGFYPQNDNEVMLNANAIERLDAHMGDIITIHTPAGDFDYRVSGFCVDEMMKYNEKYDGVCAYMTVSELDKICAANNEEGSAVYYVQFEEKAKLKSAIADVKTQYGLTGGEVEENLITVGMSGASSRAEIIRIYMMAVVVFVIILIAGVLMISSCMNSNVSQRTKFFGMMRCIGASKKQVMHFVRLEALNWCKSAIPVGIGLGIAVTWVLCVILKNLVGGEFTEYSFRLSITGIVCGALVGVVTVLLAAHSPAKRAAGVSPVAAVSGNAETGKSFSHAANTRLFKVESALGVYHAVSAKKNLILISLSFAFTVTLFLTFFAGLDFARKLLPSESDFNPDISIAAADNSNSLDRSLKEEMAALPGVEAVFGCAFAFDTPADINGTAGKVDLMSYDDYMFYWSKKSVVSGDISKITDNSDYVMTIFNMDSRLNVGDKIKIGDTELEIACVVSEGVGSEINPSVVCTEETFARITGENNYILLNAQLTEDATEETVDMLCALAGENEFADRRDDNYTMYSSFWVFRLAAYGFLGIIAVITVFNIMNSISMSVSARMKQYGAMRAVGMSAHQLTKMIAAEAVTYAVCGLIIGSAAGLYLHRKITIRLIIDHFGGVWKVPIDALVIIVLIVIFSCVVAVYAPAKRMREMEITETISEVG